MNSKRMFYIMLGLLGILIITFFGGVYGVQHLLVAKSKTLTDLKLQSQVLQGQQTDLAVAKRQIKTYADLVEIAKTVVPQDKDQAEAVREISKLANDSGLPQLSSITFPASTLGGVGAAKVNSGKLTQLAPVPGIPGVYVLQITVSLDGSTPVSYDKFVDFLSRLEQNRRTAQVGSITLQPDAKNPDLVSFSLSVNEYVKP